MNMLAFAIHTACDCLEDLWVKAREAKGARKRFFELCLSGSLPIT
jgi:hypothetical protein